MAEYVFAARNCRAKHSAKATGDAANKAERSATHYVTLSGTADTNTLDVVLNDLKKKARLKDPETVLKLALASAAAAADGIAEDSAPYQERVGKGIFQIGMGYHANDAEAAKDNIVWQNLS